MTSISSLILTLGPIINM